MSLIEASSTPAHQVRSNAGRVQGKLKAAVHAMAWEGLPYERAARKVNLSVHAMRSALDRPHVQSYLRHQRQVFRTSLVDEATFRMRELSQQDDNRAAAVTATAKLMSEHDEQVRSTQPLSAPGVCIIIQASPEMRTVSVEADKPMITDAHALP